MFSVVSFKTTSPYKESYDPPVPPTHEFDSFCPSVVCMSLSYIFI
uniref:p5 n=1 Tax=Sweet potato chlorotic stunt virus TaxID=81931 RepID=S5WHZ2_9CLOS|nr:p5 [Sweet potato chlorotic stunt virus]AGS80287.1 p5 [Sweet potato chlorotic stunt virus]QFU85088.1 p5 [Sweet potato chlorotic stunt virus]